MHDGCRLAVTCFVRFWYRRYDTKKFIMLFYLIKLFMLVKSWGLAMVDACWYFDRFRGSTKFAFFSNICAMKIVATYGDDGHDFSLMILLPGVLMLAHWNLNKFFFDYKQHFCNIYLAILCATKALCDPVWTIYLYRQWWSHYSTLSFGDYEI